MVELAAVSAPVAGTSRRVVLRATLSRALTLAASCAGVGSHAQSAPCALHSAPSAVPAGAADVRAFGALGDGRTDDTVAIQRALDALRAGQWLVFPPGRYLHGLRLVVAQQGVTLWGHGATLHATNAADQALLIQASGVRVLGFTLTSVTDQRRHAPWESRIAIWRHGEGLPALTDVEVRDNRIVESGPPGSPLANSSSSAAIFVHNVHGFVVAGNLVRRSLSDGIHITGGARHGRVLGNTVRETGDDMVAVVSYLGQGEPGTESPATVARELDRRRASELVSDVLIADNDVSGQYWGRGISVVGGEAVSILNNRIDATNHAAGVYIAREQGWSTFGVRNVLVQGNRITRVQTQSPEYSVLAPPQRWQRTGHGAVEIVAHVFDDELRIAALHEALTIRGVAVRDNVIEDAATAGVRVGLGWNRQSAQPRRSADGSMAVRRFTGASISEISIRGNRLRNVKVGFEILNAEDPLALMNGSDNRLDERPLPWPARSVALSGAQGWDADTPGSAVQACTRPRR